MAKGQDVKKAVKKEPLKTAKEKKEEKRDKKNSKKDFSQIVSHKAKSPAIAGLFVMPPQGCQDVSAVFVIFGTIGHQHNFIYTPYGTLLFALGTYSPGKFFCLPQCTVP